MFAKKEGLKILTLKHTENISFWELKHKDHVYYGCSDFNRPLLPVNPPLLP